LIFVLRLQVPEGGFDVLLAPGQIAQSLCYIFLVSIVVARGTSWGIRRGGGKRRRGRGGFRKGGVTGRKWEVVAWWRRRGWGRCVAQGVPEGIEPFNPTPILI
jgi:hypothetical protein